MRVAVVLVFLAVAAGEVGPPAVAWVAVDGPALAWREGKSASACGDKMDLRLV